MEGSVSQHIRNPPAARALTRILRECDVESLAALYFGLREGIGSPVLCEVTDEVVRASLRRSVRVLEVLSTMLEAHHGPDG